MVGGLLLLHGTGFLKNATNVFLGSIFVLAAAAFLSLLFVRQWWALFPGMTLLVIGLLILIPESLTHTFGGAIILGGIGLSFWLVYLTDRIGRWWALIPAGVLTTLAIVTVLPEQRAGMATGGVFFLGLAATFLLVAFLTGMRWAYYPAVVLAVIGIITTLSVVGFANYIWSFALIAGGGYLLFRYFGAS
jgi:hypothetical protein